MKRYIALLRGINISGKNKLNMSDLKICFAELGYKNVFTYLNSGNVVFSSDDIDESVLADVMRSMLKEKFCMDIPIFIILQKELEKLLSKAPYWWGNDDKKVYDNLIFVIPPSTSEIIADKIGKPTKDLEKINIYQYTIFWSFDKMQYSKCNWWKKTASKGIGEMITIRTANTLRKIVKM